MRTEATTLTDKQQEMLAYILRFRERNGREPSLGQMCKVFTCDRSVLSRRRASLRNKGLLLATLSAA